MSDFLEKNPDIREEGLSKGWFREETNTEKERDETVWSTSKETKTQQLHARSSLAGLGQT